MAGRAGRAMGSRRPYSNSTIHYDPLTWVRLQNFRSFQDTGCIEIKPINVLVGANSSGKSSILRFFPLLENSISKRFDGVFRWLNEDVDFSDFKNTVRDGQSKINIAMGFGDIFSLSFDVVSDKDYTEKFENVTFFKNGNKDISLDFDNYSYTKSGDFLPFAIGTYNSDNPQFVQLGEFNARSEEMERDILSFTKGMSYIRPIRADIARYNRTANVDVSKVRGDGSNMPMYLFSLEEYELGNLNKWLLSNFGFSILIKKAGGTFEIIISDGIDKPRNAVDLGFGYTEMLPILVAVWGAIFGPQRSQNIEGGELFLAIEQPEVHLHPKFQAKFAKMICQIINEYPNIRFFIETHSETILNVFGSEIAYQRANPEDINVILVHKQEGISHLKQTGYDNEGYLIDWPINFFNEFGIDGGASPINIDKKFD